MQLTYLGDTGLKVSTLCLGAMTFGTDWGWGANEAECRRMLDLFADQGGNFVDTANAYTNGESERMLGRFLADRRDRFVVGTKYTISTDPSDANASGNGRKTLTRALEASLRRLGTDYVDLYWVHMWDGFTPVEETVRALDDAVRAGKVLHVGFSDHPAWLVARADALAEARGLTRPAAIQVEYSLAQREAERELIPMAERLGLSVLDWSPLAGGALTGKYLTPGAEGRVATGGVAHFERYAGEATRVVAQAVVDAADQLGCPASALAVAWLRAASPAHIPIVGARSAAQLADTLGAATLDVPAEVFARLDEVSQPSLGFPHDFLRKGWDRWFHDGPTRLDPRVRPQGRKALGLG